MKTSPLWAYLVVGNMTAEFRPQQAAGNNIRTLDFGRSTELKTKFVKLATRDLESKQDQGWHGSWLLERKKQKPRLSCLRRLSQSCGSRGIPNCPLATWHQ